MLVTFITVIVLIFKGNHREVGIWTCSNKGFEFEKFGDGITAPFSGIRSERLPELPNWLPRLPKLSNLVENVVPCDRCDREQDYETAWKLLKRSMGRRSIEIADESKRIP